jgi:glycosyltransferase 2 family protein
LPDNILICMKKYLKLSLKILVSLGFVIWIILNTNWSEVWFYVKEISVWKLSFYVVFILLGILVSSYKWKMLTDFKNINHSLWDHFRFYQAGAFINNFLPSFIGGDTFRAYQIGQRDKKYVEAVSTVLMDRITGFIGSTILVVFFSLLNIHAILQNKTLLIIDLLVLASLVFDFIVAKTKKMQFWKKISHFMPQKLVLLFSELDGYNGKSRILWRTIWWGMIFGVVGVAIPNYILFWALGLHINILDYLSVIFLISIITAVPISVNNIGVKEWAYVTFFGVFGVNAAAVVAISIISRFIQMIISFFALPTYLKSKK